MNVLSAMNILSVNVLCCERFVCERVFVVNVFVVVVLSSCNTTYLYHRHENLSITSILKLSLIEDLLVGVSNFKPSDATPVVIAEQLSAGFQSKLPL